MADLHDLGAAEAARAVRSGVLSPVDPMAACLERIFAEARLPGAAAWCEWVIGFAAAPRL